MEKIILFANFVMIVLIWLKRGDEKANPTSSQSIGLQSPSFFTPEQNASIYEPYYDLNSDLIKGYSEQFIKNNPGFVPTKSANKEPEPEPEPEPELTGYGLLYNRVVIDAEEKSVAPAGTRIPSQTDSNTLIGYLTGNGGATIDNLISKGWKLQYAGHSFGISNFYNFDLKAYYHTTDRDLNDSPLLFVIDTVLNRITSGVSGDEYSKSIRCILTNPETWQPGDTVTDIDGNIYKTVKIGNQVWVNENLKTTKFNDGTPITFPESALTWLMNPHYIYPNGDENNV